MDFGSRVPDNDGDDNRNRLRLKVRTKQGPGNGIDAVVVAARRMID
jgi:hypothetical protein